MTGMTGMNGMKGVCAVCGGRYRLRFDGSVWPHKVYPRLPDTSTAVALCGGSNMMNKAAA